MNYPTYFTPQGYSPYPQQTVRFDGSIQPPAQPAPAGAPGFAVRPVTSREEAVAAQIDFLGPGTIMPDLSHNVIYLKRFNPQTGASDFYVFALRLPEPEPTPVEYATKEDFLQLRAELEQLKPKKAVKKNDPDE